MTVLQYNICPVVIVPVKGSEMRRTELRQEIRKMRWQEAYEGWDEARLTQAEAAGIWIGSIAPLRMILLSVVSG
jgi:hypothetical protein